jgi:hypothetical protein
VSSVRDVTTTLKIIAWREPRWWPKRLPFDHWSGLTRAHSHAASRSTTNVLIWARPRAHEQRQLACGWGPYAWHRVNMPCPTCTTAVTPIGLDVMNGRVGPLLSRKRVVVCPSTQRGAHSKIEGGEMATVPPYHSSNPADPDVYHDHDDCPTGRQIPSRNLVPGTGGYRRCHQCEDLD